MTAPRRPILRYYGGKWRLAPWVIARMPRHRCYVEPFGGGASVLLRKPRSIAEVYNDIDEEIVAFFRVLREHPAELIRAIRLTPFSRAEFERSAQRVDVDPVERARRTYVRCWQAMHAGLRPNRTGWRHCRGTGRLTTAAHEFADVEHLEAIVERLRAAQIECDDAFTVIRRYDAPETLFYVDPPYLPETRSHRWGRDGYKHEFAPERHDELLGALREVRGMVMLSGYPCERYNTALVSSGWIRVDRNVVTFRAGTATECLWFNPEALKRSVSLFEQQRLGPEPIPVDGDRCRGRRLATNQPTPI